MNPKMVPEFDPQNGVQKWHPKNGVQKWHPQNGVPNILHPRRRGSKLYLQFGAIFGPHFGGQILAPFLGPFFNPHFGVQNMVQNLQFFCCQSFHLHSNFFQQTCITKCICSHCLASCISAHNPILHLAKPLKNRKVLIATNVAHEQDGFKASESDTVEVLKCGTSFPHEK